MKKILLLTLSLSFVNLYSQNATLFDIGIKAVGRTSISTTSSLQNATFSGIGGGVFATVNFPIGIGAQIDGIFNVQNIELDNTAVQSIISDASSNNQNLNFDPNDVVRLTYITVPVLLHYNFLKILAVELGPQFNFLLNKDVHMIGSDPFGQSFSTQGVVGLRVSILRFSFYARYIQDLSNVTSSTLSDVIGDTKNINVQLGVGFALFKK